MHKYTRMHAYTHLWTLAHAHNYTNPHTHIHTHTGAISVTVWQRCGGVHGLYHWTWKVIFDFGGVFIYVLKHHFFPLYVVWYPWENVILFLLSRRRWDASWEGLSSEHQCWGGIQMHSDSMRDLDNYRLKILPMHGGVLSDTWLSMMLGQCIFLNNIKCSITVLMLITCEGSMLFFIVSNINNYIRIILGRNLQANVRLLWANQQMRGCYAARSVLSQHAPRRTKVKSNSNHLIGYNNWSVDKSVDYIF